MKGIVVLGSTGSVGRQTLDVIRSFRDQFTLVGLAGGSNRNLLAEQAREFRPALVWCQTEERRVPSSTFPGCRFVSMEEMVCHPDVDMVVVATAGGVGLGPTLAALSAGKSVALANKEVIVMAGELIAQKGPGWDNILPVDSEPSAIWQCLQGEDHSVFRLIITASGGPFRTLPRSKLGSVTPEEALRHPTWQMGKKITIDSATLMNKAFEVIEVRWLFNMPWEKIDVVVHPQSIVHSLVEFEDGSIKAQLSYPDMRLPIQYALLHPRRLPNGHRRGLDLAEVTALTFEPLDIERHPCFSLALAAARAGGTYPAALNAADEVAVDLFLQKRIGFLEIPSLVEKVVNSHSPGSATSLDDILDADAWARRRALELAGV